MQRKRRLCLPLLSNPQTFTARNDHVYVMEIGITGSQCRSSPFSAAVGGENCEYVRNAGCSVVNNMDLRTRSDSSAWSQ